MAALGAYGEPVAEEGHAGVIWHEIDYEAAWRPFDAKFDFRPNIHGSSGPAMRIPDDAVIIDLRPIFAGPGAQFAAGEAAVHAAAARSFVWLCGDEELTALDWQHPAYKYSPAKQVLSNAAWNIPVSPHGDYYVHATVDLRWGTFRHPWQHWLCIWGQELVETLAPELLAWLPRRSTLPSTTLIPRNVPSL